MNEEELRKHGDPPPSHKIVTYRTCRPMHAALKDGLGVDMEELGGGPSIVSLNRALHIIMYDVISGRDRLKKAYLAAVRKEGPDFAKQCKNCMNRDLLQAMKVDASKEATQ